jgi:hypothetical protein
MSSTILVGEQTRHYDVNLPCMYVASKAWFLIFRNPRVTYLSSEDSVHSTDPKQSLILFDRFVS